MFCIYHSYLLGPRKNLLIAIYLVLYKRVLVLLLVLCPEKHVDLSSLLADGADGTSLCAYNVNICKTFAVKIKKKYCTCVAIYPFGHAFR